MKLADQLREVQEALSALAPFDVVQGDAIQRTNPSNRQMVNSNIAWAVSSGALRSAHKTRQAIDAVNRLPALIEAVSALEAQACPSGVGDDSLVELVREGAAMWLDRNKRVEIPRDIAFDIVKKLRPYLSPSQEQQSVSEEEVASLLADVILERGEVGGISAMNDGRKQCQALKAAGYSIIRRDER